MGRSAGHPRTSLGIGVDAVLCPSGGPAEHVGRALFQVQDHDKAEVHCLIELRHSDDVAVRQEGQVPTTTAVASVLLATREAHGNRGSRLQTDRPIRPTPRGAGDDDPTVNPLRRHIPFRRPGWVIVIVRLSLQRCASSG